MNGLKKKLGGYKRDLIRFSKGAAPKYQDFNAIHQALVTSPAPVIFDVGAHRGESIERFRELFPNSDIHAFEADSENFAWLDGYYTDRDGLHLNHFAAGAAPGTKTFHRNAKSDTSSFNRLNADTDWMKLRSAQYNTDPSGFTLKSYDVTIDTIDRYMNREKIAQVDILKMDTQGFEDEVLKGCANALKTGAIKLIETEIIMGNMYDKSLSFYDLEQMLIPAGYQFYAIDRAGNLLQNQAMAFNVIYVHKSAV